MNVRGLSSQACRSKKLSQLKLTMSVYKLPFLLLCESHLDNQAWVKALAEVPTWQGRCLANPNEPNSKEFGILVSGDASASVSEKILDIPDIPKGALGICLTIDNMDINIVLIHAPNQHSARRSFFTTLKNALNAYDSEQQFALIGDFNCVELPEDRLPQRDHDAGIKELQDLTNSLNVFDVWRKIGRTKSSFTYAQSNPKALSRIDRFYLPPIWIDQACQWETIPFPGSDHSIIKTRLNIHEQVGQRRPWRLNPKILKNDELLQEVLARLPQTDENGNLSANPSHPTECEGETREGKHHTTNVDESNSLQVWLQTKEKIPSICRRNQQKRANKLNSRIKSLCTKITRLQIKGEPTDNPIEDLAQALDQYGSSARMANFERWRKSGNQVNPYTLCKVRPKGEPTVIKALRTSTANELGEKPIDAIIHNFYGDLYGPSTIEEAAVETTVAQLKSTLKHRGLKKTMHVLETPITAKEVLQSINSLKSSGKSPGPDGLGIEFYKAMGTSIATVLTLVFNSLLNGAKAPRAFIEGMVILLFKKGDPTLLKNYRPITLLNVDYKILTKLLALRLSGSLEPFINKNQTAFLPGRLIGTNIRDVQLTIHHLEQDNTLPGILLFLDQEKAYDRVNHTFLWKILKTFRIPRKIRSLIRGLYHKAQSTVIVDGVKCTTFRISRGVRQGDPLSCILFTCVMESLACLLDDLPIGIPLPMCPSLKYTMYADDTVIGLKHWTQYPLLKQTLDLYCRASGAKFNTDKTEVLATPSAGEPPPDLPTPVSSGTWVRHLGVPVGWQLSDQKAWEPCIEKIKAGLSRLNLSCLSLKGRINVIKALIIPKFMFLARYLAISTRQLTYCESWLSQAVWCNRRSKVNKYILGLPPNEGGLGFLTLSILFDAYKLVAIRDFYTSDGARWTEILRYNWQLRASTRLRYPMQVVQHYLGNPWTQSAKQMGGISTSWPQYWTAVYRYCVKHDGTHIEMYCQFRSLKEIPLWYTPLTTFGESRIWSTIRPTLHSQTSPQWWHEAFKPDGSWQEEAFSQVPPPQRKVIMEKMDSFIPTDLRSTMIRPTSSWSNMNVAALINNVPIYLSTTQKPTDFYGPLIIDQVTKMGGYIPTVSDMETPLGAAQGNPWTHLWKIPVIDSVKVFLWELSRQSLLTRHRFRDKPRENRMCGCSLEEETPQHLFLECERILPLVTFYIHTQNEIFHRLAQKQDFSWAQWKNLYRVNLIQKNPSEDEMPFNGDLETFTQLSQVQWSYLLWSIWLERNKETFDGKPWDITHCIARYSQLMSREIRSKMKVYNGLHDKGIFPGIEWLYIQSISKWTSQEAGPQAEVHNEARAH